MTTTTTGDGRSHGSAGGKRPDIQLLRALAIVLVVLFHLDVVWMSGGFVGVDVFFVISGYLVFGSMRRVKRLTLPSTVLLLGVVVVLPFTQMCAKGLCSGTFDPVSGAAGHVANEYFYFASKDYFREREERRRKLWEGESVVLHFWSLAVEEQTYVAVPALLMLLRACAPPRVAVRAGPVLLVAAGWVSLIVAVVLPTQTTFKFFSMSTRLWEFLAGAFVAWLHDHSHYGTPSPAAGAAAASTAPAIEMRTLADGGGVSKRHDDDELVAPLEDEARPLSAVQWQNVMRASTFAVLFLLGVAYLVHLGHTVSNEDYPNGATVVVVSVTAALLLLQADVEAAVRGWAAVVRHYRRRAGSRPAAWLLLAGEHGVALVNPYLVAPLVFLGDVSYSVYLYHWPLIQIAKHAGQGAGVQVFAAAEDALAAGPADALGFEGRAAVVATTALLALLSYRHVEQPAQRMRLGGRAMLMLFLAASLGTAGFAQLVGYLMYRRYIAQRDAYSSQYAAWDAQLGQNYTQPWWSNAPLVRKQEALRADMDAMTPTLLATMSMCNSELWRQGIVWNVPWFNHDDRRSVGSQGSDGGRVLVLVGDSHAGRLIPTFRQHAAALNVSFLTNTRPRSEGASTKRYMSGIIDDTAPLPEVFTQYPRRLVVLTAYVHPRMTCASFLAVLARWTAEGEVVLLADNPNADLPELRRLLRRERPVGYADPCLRTLPANTTKSCSPPRDVVLSGRDAECFREIANPRHTARWWRRHRHTRVTDAVLARVRARAALAATADFYCGDGRCPSRFLNLPVFYDSNHLCETFVEFLRPYLLARVAASPAHARFLNASTTPHD